MSKNIEFVAALCVTVSLMTGCTSYSEGSSAAIEGFSEGATGGTAKEASGIASSEASAIASSEVSGISKTSSESVAAASSSSVSSEASSASSSASLEASSTSSSVSSVASSASSKLSSDEVSSKISDVTKNKKKDDKSKSKKKAKNGILTPEISDGITKIGDRGVEVAFEWEPDDDADIYEVYAEGKSRDSEAYSHIETLYTDKPNYSYQDKLNYDIRIKVRAYKGDIKKKVCGEWSEFAFGNTREDSLEAPKVKDGVARKGANGTEVYFTWEAVEGAEHYEVVVEHKSIDESEYDIKEVTYTNAPNYTYSAKGSYDVRITVKAQTNAWINGKKKVFNSKVSSYAKGKTY